MIENINDWLSLLVLAGVLVMVLAIVLHMANLQMIARHIRQEEEYYRIREEKEPAQLANEKLTRQEKRRIE